LSTLDYIEVTTLGDLVVRGADRYGDADAIVFPDSRRTYDELLDGSIRAARSLRALGVGPGDHVGVLMANCVEYAEILFGTAMLGGVAVLLNARYRGAELRYVVENADLKVVVTSDIVAEHVDHVDRLRDAFPALRESRDPRHLALADAPELESIVFLGPPTENLVDRVEFEAGAETVDEDEVHRLRSQVAIRDLGMMMYTSGTTAHPKGCLMTHEMVVRNGMNAGRKRFEIQPTDRFWDPLPMFHMSAILPLMGCLDAGAAWLGMTHFEPGAALTMMREEGATLAFPTFPPITQALLNHPDWASTSADLDIRMLCNISAPDTLRKLQEQWAPAIQITAYGCTEIGGVACFNEATDTLEQRVTTSGRPFPGIQLRVVDPSNRPVPTGERGEIVARGYSVFEGYYKDPERTAEVIDDEGWFHTGDIGSMDADGRVSYLGRLKDMLKVGGENVAAAEIEALVEGHPAVAIAQVVSFPDDRLMEVPAAFVQLKPGATVSESELIEFCQGKVASFKIPRFVRIVDEWPMSATKIQKFKLRHQLAEELGVVLEEG
jgi:fatty-acyl-CoA synthase